MAESKLSLSDVEDTDDYDDKLDEKNGVITLASNRSEKMIPSPNLHGLSLGLDLAFAASDSKKYEYDHIQEASVLVIFDLPDGSQGESSFKLGQTVEVLKSFIEISYGIPMENQKLYIDDKLMLNPYSLLDFPEAKGCNEIYVRVEGDLPANSRK
eukprot:gene14462-19410_t